MQTPDQVGNPRDPLHRMLGTARSVANYPENQRLDAGSGVTTSFYFHIGGWHPVITFWCHILDVRVSDLRPYYAKTRLIPHTNLILALSYHINRTLARVIT